MNLFGRLRAWLSVAGAPRPTTLAGVPSGDQAPARGASLAPFTNPSSGLVHVNDNEPSTGGAYRPVSDLDRIEVSLYGRPGRHQRVVSLSRSFGDEKHGQLVLDGRKTVIAARRAAPTLQPGGIPTRDPWQGADWRTAPSGATGAAAVGMHSFGVDAPRTSQREVPPTDAASAGVTSPPTIPSRSW